MHSLHIVAELHNRETGSVPPCESTAVQTTKINDPSGPMDKLLHSATISGTKNVIAYMQREVDTKLDW